MKQINALIVDDEENGREVLSQLLLRFCHQVNILSTARNLPEAVEKIKTLQPDLVFLDVEMPEYAGYEISRFFDEINFEIIFVTAYDQYAINAFDLSAVDYLLKPIEIDRLKKSIEKATGNIAIKDYKQQLDSLLDNLTSNDQPKLSILDKGFRRTILLKDIIALEAQGAYTKIYIEDEQSVVVSKHMKQLEDEFDSVQYLHRTHRSWIINSNFIERYSKSRQQIMMKQDIIARLSRSFKPHIEKLIA